MPTYLPGFESAWLWLDMLSSEDNPAWFESRVGVNFSNSGMPIVVERLFPFLSFFLKNPNSGGVLASTLSMELDSELNGSVVFLLWTVDVEPEKWKSKHSFMNWVEC